MNAGYWRMIVQARNEAQRAYAAALPAMEAAATVERQMSHASSAIAQKARDDVQKVHDEVSRTMAHPAAVEAMAGVTKFVESTEGSLRPIRKAVEEATAARALADYPGSVSEQSFSLVAFDSIALSPERRLGVEVAALEDEVAELSERVDRLEPSDNN